MNRRWTQLPLQPSDLNALLRAMLARREIAPIPGLPDVYEITLPYARGGLLDEQEILLEDNPYATLSHFTALAFHGLTLAQPNTMMATVAQSNMGDLLPIDTEPRDWEDLLRPPARRRKTVLRTGVHWQTVKSERFFGFAEYQPYGSRKRVTTPERTLIDGLQSPELCGGINNVLSAWPIAGPTLDLDALVALVDRYDVQVLRQRVGFILDRLGLSHPELSRWQAGAKRGGSSRLVGSAPFAPIFDERWNLSLNAPTWALGDDGG